MSVAGPTRARFPAGLLGGHVPRRADQKTALRHRLAAFDRLGQAEVGDHQVEGGGGWGVGGHDWSVVGAQRCFSSDLRRPDIIRPMRSVWVTRLVSLNCSRNPVALAQDQMGFELQQRSPGDTQVMKEFLRVLPALALGDVRRYRGCRSPNLTRQAE